MRAPLTYALPATVLGGYLLLAGGRGVQLMRTGEPAAAALGAAASVLPLIGAWFLWRTTVFAYRAERLARELSAEGGLPADDLPRTPGGRVEPAAADAVFARRRAEAERSPDDWRCWFRLAVAYRDARDTARARRAIQRAIALRAGRPVRP
ncbi:hypothetical protein RKE29_23545 [Streptomyces sp. B1866]|uniref:hypothetical protein n=1 Tax=Streptomyces sp. B1866 TaxID=3075431 RepID=UPI00288DB73C|nr:hypothetical protein [Streptomyces sp. B1866]MDT3399581.1 hypothetical protein [Streptomyces sp. B1866]